VGSEHDFGQFYKNTKYFLSPWRERIKSLPRTRYGVRGDTIWRSTPGLALRSGAGLTLPPAYRQAGIEGGGDRWESFFIVRTYLPNAGRAGLAGYVPVNMEKFNRTDSGH